MTADALQVLGTIDEVRRKSRRRAVVMTMGALHEGHLSLMRAARAAVGQTGEVLVTVFVNPLQFGAGEDFERYPRTLAADIEACRSAGVDTVFAPTAEEMYPTGAPRVMVVPSGPAAEGLEADVRPGHFAGMLTVVAKLMGITVPDVALFGEKDYQQLVLISTMVADLNIDTDVMAVATSREPDGLARSSRNVYLSAEERAAAAAIPRSLRAAQTSAAQGHPTAAVRDAALAELRDLDVDYLEVRAPDLAEPPASGEARLLVAARLGSTRLLDNCAVELRPS